MGDYLHPHEVVDDLTVAFAQVIRKGFGNMLSDDYSTALARLLCEEQTRVLAGLCIYFPARGRVDREGIARAWDAGQLAKQIMREFSCSKTTAYMFRPAKKRRVRHDRSTVCSRGEP